MLYYLRRILPFGRLLAWGSGAVFVEEAPLPSFFAGQK